MSGLRILIYDRTCRGLPVGLSHAWWLGSKLYQGLGRLDARIAASSWRGALQQLVAEQPERPISELQYWGHGKWGTLLLAGERLDRTALRPGHPLHGPLTQLGRRLTPDAALWFRTCESFGASAGHEFARAVTDFFGVRAAGHTYVIGYWQSGLHQLVPGERPHWALDEGVLQGTARQPRRARISTPFEPNTISCLSGSIPAGW